MTFIIYEVGSNWTLKVKVYIVFNENSFYGDDFHGVYGTQVEAQKQFDYLKDEGCYPYIQEREIEVSV